MGFDGPLAVGVEVGADDAELLVVKHTSDVETIGLYVGREQRTMRFGFQVGNTCFGFQLSVGQQVLSAHSQFAFPRDTPQPGYSSWQL